MDQRTSFAACFVCTCSKNALPPVGDSRLRYAIISGRQTLGASGQKKLVAALTGGVGCLHGSLERVGVS